MVCTAQVEATGFPCCSDPNELHCVLQQRMFIVGAIVPSNITAILVNSVLDKGQKGHPIYLIILLIFSDKFADFKTSVSFSTRNKNKYVP